MEFWRRSSSGVVAAFASLLVQIGPLTMAHAAPHGSGEGLTFPTFVITLASTPTPTRTPTPIHVGNFVRDDLDGDGRQDVGEPGLPDVTVQLWNSAKDDLIASAVTNASGNYTVVAPVPGNYRVRVVLPGNNDQFSPENQAGGDDLLDSDFNVSGTNFGFTDVYVFGANLISITSIDCGIIKFRTPTPTRTPTPINIGNFVWSDLDGDGVQDAGEPGLAGVNVQLWNGAKNDLIATTTTNANGNYTVVAPVPGDYRIRVLLPDPDDAFSPNDSGSDLSDSDINPSGTDFGFTDVIDIGPNVISITSIDAGIITPPVVDVGDLVWADDGDGVQDRREPGVAAVVVELWDSAKTTMYDRTKTDSDGAYRLDAPGPGQYRVFVDAPGGAKFAPKDVGIGTLGEGQDSDINPTGAHTGFTDTFTIVAGVTQNLRVDAGLLLANTPTRTVTRTATNTVPANTPTRTPTPSQTPTRTVTNTIPANTPTRTPSHSPTRTATNTVAVNTPTRTPTPSQTPSRTATHTAPPQTATPLPTNTATRTPTSPLPPSTATRTATHTVAVSTATRTPTLTNTATATFSQTLAVNTTTRTPAPTSTRTATHTETANTPTLPAATPSPSRTATATLIPSQTPSRTATIAATAAPTATRTLTATLTPSVPFTATRTASPSPSRTATSVATTTFTGVPTTTPAIALTPSPTRSATPSATPDNSLVQTPTSTPTATRSGTASSTATGTPTATRTPDLIPTSTRLPPACVGDCNRNQQVTIEELVRGVNIALQRAEMEQCLPFDPDGSATVSVNELVQGVRNLLQGCPLER